MYCSLDLASISAMDWINLVCQIIISLAAIIAILITIQQVKSKKKYSIRVSYDFGLGVIRKSDGNPEVIEGLNIIIRNVGIAPVYYENCGIKFVKDKHYKKSHNYPGIFIAELDKNHGGCLKPGDSARETTFNINELITKTKTECEVFGDDRVFIFLDLCNGKKLYWDTGETYNKFYERHVMTNEKRLKSIKSI